MLQSTYHNKNTNEDPKTSSVFETILMLPDELFCGVSRTNFFGNVFCNFQSRYNQT